MELDAVESDNISKRLPLNLESKDSIYDDDETDVIGPIRRCSRKAKGYLYEFGTGLPCSNGMFEMKFRAFLFALEFADGQVQVDRPANTALSKQGLLFFGLGLILGDEAALQTAEHPTHTWD